MNSMATNIITNPNLYDILARRLPEDIVSEIIFIRLSVKDILRLRSVCKSWLFLISSPDFIKTHHYKVTNDPHLTHHHLLLSRRNNIDVHVLDAYLGFESCSLYSLLLQEPNKGTVGLEYPENVVRFVGYSNGLACMLCDNSNDNVNVMLWNPSTRKSRMLPRLDVKLENPSYEFCYDESDDDFKVFVVFGCDAYEFSVYSSKSDNWSMIEDFPFAEVLSERTYVNGAMYGVVGTSDSDITDIHQNPKIIVSLDTKTGTCREVLLPKYREGAYDWSLGTFGKNLSILCKFETFADLWAMKECGAEMCWTKMLTLPYVNKRTWGKHLKPICISVNGDVLVNFDSVILLYNSKDKSYEILLHNDYKEILDVYTYVESLVSP